MQSPEHSATLRGQKRPAPRGSAAYPRKRAITACQVCRSRRTKCDNQRPACGFCARTGATCNYSTEADDFSSFDPASLRILARLDDLEGQLQSLQTSSGSQSAEDFNLKKDKSWLLPVGPDQLLRFDDKEQSQLLHTLVSPITNPIVETTISPTAVADLDTASSRRLVDNFFSYVHVKNPILQEAQTRRMVSQLCLYGADWSTESCLALLICALGSLGTPFGDSRDALPGSPAYSAGLSYFHAAQRRLGNCITRTGVLEAQCLFLSGVFQMYIFRPFDAWRLFSQALSCCQSFTFLRQQNQVAQSLHEQNASLDSQVAEQSIYWSSWKSELELRGSWNMTDFMNSQPGILYPSFFPTPPQDFSDEDPALSSDCQNLGWYFYLTEISLRRMLSRISDDILHFKPRKGQSMLEGLAETLPGRLQEVETWLEALPEVMSPHSAPEEDDVCKFVLRGHIVNAYEMLYWPFLAKYLLDTNEQDTETKLRELAETALTWHVERIKVNQPGFTHRHHGTWFMIGSCTRSIVMLMKAQDFNLNCSPSSVLQMPSGWKDAVRDGIELNASWQQEAFDAQRRLPYLHRLMQRVGIHASADIEFA